MAWTLWLLDQLQQIDLVKLSLVPIKSAGAALGGYLLKRIWRWYMTSDNLGMKCILSRKGCNNFRGNGMRGLCSKCYKRANDKVKSGETTWDELVNMGLCEDINDPFTEAFNHAKEQGK